MKKTSNWTGKQCFFYVCGEHYPKDGDSSDEEWPAGDSDDQMEDSEGEKEGSSKKESKGSSEDEPEENSDGSESED